MNIKKVFLKLLTTVAAVGGLGLLGEQTANAKSLGLVTAADAFNTQGQISSSFTGTAGTGDNQLTATYMTGPRATVGQMVGGSLPFPNTSTNNYYSYSRVGSGYDTSAGFNPLLNYNIASAWVDTPNVNVNVGDKTNDYSTMYGDVKNVSDSSYPFTYAPSGSASGMLYDSSALMINSSSLNAVPVKNKDGSVEKFTDSKYDNKFFKPLYTNVKSYTKTDNGVEIKFTSYYSQATTDTSGQPNVSADKTLSVDNTLKLSKLPSGSMLVQESSTNLSFDLDNVYLARQNDSYVQDLDQAFTFNSANNSKADSLPFKYLGNNRGMYLDASEANIPLKLTYEFDVSNGPNAWRADFQPDWQTTDRNGFYPMPIGSDGIFTSLDSTGDSNHDTNNQASLGDQVNPPKVSVPEGSSTSDSGVTMKWGKYDTWKKGDTIDTSYIEGLSSSPAAPTINVNETKADVNLGDKIPLTGWVTDDDATTNKAEKIYYSVDSTDDSDGKLLSTIDANGAEDGALGSIDTTGWTPGAHVVRLWAIDADGNVSSNIATVYVNIETKLVMDDDADFKLYYSMPKGGGNTQIDSANFNGGFIGNDNSKWSDSSSVSGTNFFTIKSLSDQSPFTTNPTGAHMFLNVYNSDKDPVYSDDDPETPGVMMTYGGEQVKNSDSTYSLKAKDGWIYSSMFSPALDPQQKYEFNYSWAAGEGNSAPYQTTTDTRPFVIVAPKVTLDNSKTLVTDTPSSQITLTNGNQITGNNAVTGSNGSKYIQNGDKVYVFKDQGGDGVYTKDDETFDADTTNAITNTTADSNGDFTLDIPDDTKLTAGDKLWVVETNGSGGTSGTAGGGVDGTELASGAGATGVTVQSAFGFTSYKNWDFGTDQEYRSSQNNSYSLKSSSNANNTTGTDSLNFVDGLRNLQLNAKMSPLVSADGKQTINGVSIDLNGTYYSSDNANGGSTMAKKVINTNDYTSIIQWDNLEASRSSLTNWNVNFGSLDATTENGVTLNVPAGQRINPDSGQFTSTIDWQLVNSLS